jgi:hypothetical protein
MLQSVICIYVNVLDIDSKLFEMSKNGDLKAMAKYQLRKTSQQQIYFVEKNNNKK